MPPTRHNSGGTCRKIVKKLRQRVAQGVFRRKRKIKHLEEVLGRKIPYNANNFESVLESAVSEALDKELMSLSKAAVILNASVEYAMKL